MPAAGRPRSITLAAIGLAVGAITSIELTRRIMFEVLEILGPPPMEHRPLAFLVFMTGIALWLTMLAVAGAAGLGVVTAGRVLRGYAWSRYEGLLLSALGAVLALVAAGLGVLGEQSLIWLLALLATQAAIALALVRGGSWFEDTPRQLFVWLRRPVPIEVPVDDE